MVAIAHAIVAQSDPATATADTAAAAFRDPSSPGLFRPLPPESDASIASALMLPRDVQVVRVASDTAAGGTGLQL